MFPINYSWDVVTDQATMTWAEGILATAAHHFRALAVDTETTGLATKDHDLVLIQVATPDHAFLIPQHLGLNQDGLCKILADPDTTKLMQYAPFDWGYLRSKLGLDARPIFDTRKAAEGLGIPSGKRGLKDLTRRYCQVTMSKVEQVTFKVGQSLSADQERYAAIDALCLWPIALGMMLHGKPDVGIVTDEDLAPMRGYLDGSSAWPSRPQLGAAGPAPRPAA